MRTLLALLPAILLVAVPTAGFFLTEAVKRAFAWANRAITSPLLKAALAFVVASLLVKLQTMSGVPLPTDLGSLNGGAVTSILFWLASMGVHALSKLPASATPSDSSATPPR